jgi:FtsP/CotA-like multicopper oxidase with cupredoxin domain
LSDKRFDPRTGALVFDQFALDGFLGDKYTVNGIVQPFFNVARRKYRFRIDDPGIARFYQLVLYANGAVHPFTQITTNGNFLERPRRLTRLEFQPGERHDIVVDFRQFTEGTEVFLANVLPQNDGREPERDERLNPANVNNQLMKFIVGATVADPSRIPDAFRPFPPINLNEVVARKNWEFERTNGMWVINGRLFDPEADHLPQRLANPQNPIRRNTAEIWTLEAGGGWEHPVHIHFEEGQRISNDGQSIPVSQRCREDTYSVGGDNVRHIQVFQRFRDFPDPDFRPSAPPGLRGRYVIHCHNTTHEDHAMMQTWNIVDPNVP